MNKYILDQPFKTKIFNTFRKIFTIPTIEKALVKQTLKSNRWFVSKLIPPDYLYKKGSYRMVVRDGIHYKLDISHVVDHFIYYGIKDPGINFVVDKIRQAKVILDIGANIGNSSLFFASQNTSSKILSFEPHPGTYQRALENFRLNSFSNITLYNIGLGEEKAMLKLYEVNDNNPGMNRIVNKELEMPYKTVKVEKLDDFLSVNKVHKVDFIKIDVEGYEYSVLKGGEILIKNNHPLLFIELDDDNLKENDKSAKGLVELLVSFGYKDFFRADTQERVSPSADFSGCHFDIVALYD